MYCAIRDQRFQQRPLFHASLLTCKPAYMKCCLSCLAYRFLSSCQVSPKYGRCVRFGSYRQKSTLCQTFVFNSQEAIVPCTMPTQVQTYKPWPACPVRTRSSYSYAIVKRQDPILVTLCLGHGIGSIVTARVHGKVVPNKNCKVLLRTIERASIYPCEPLSLLLSTF